MKKFLLFILPLLGPLLGALSSQAQQVELYSAHRLEATQSIKLKTVTITDFNQLAPLATTKAATDTTINFSSTKFQSLTITDATTFLQSNITAGREIYLRVIATGGPHTLTFPAGWVWLGATPANIASGKTGLLILRSYGTAATQVLAQWFVQP